jgi:hypothetical protein
MQIVPTVGKTFGESGGEGNAKGQGAKARRSIAAIKNEFATRDHNAGSRNRKD